MNLYEKHGLSQYVNLDVVSGLLPLLQSGQYHISAETGKITQTGPPASSFDTPWIYVRNRRGLNCNIMQPIMFQQLNVFPPTCLSCWKVVVRMPTVEDLFKMLDYQTEESERYCKCGIELREYVHGNYGAYFYTQSMDEGLEVYREVKEDMKLFGIEGSVSLKRYCTEFEMRFGPSSKQEEHPKTIEGANVYEILKKVLDPSMFDQKFTQPGISKVHVARKWLEHAWSVGDPTAIKFNDGKPFYSDTEKYHEVDPRTGVEHA